MLTQVRHCLCSCSTPSIRSCSAHRILHSTKCSTSSASSRASISTVSIVPAAAPSRPVYNSESALPRKPLSEEARGRILCRPSNLTPTPPFTAATNLPKLQSLSQNQLLSRTTSLTTATKIDGTAIAKVIRGRIRSEIEATQKIKPDFRPSLKIIQVGNRSDSTTYVRMKLKAAEEANIDCELVHYPEGTTEAQLIEDIHRLNNDPAVHGILVQLPLPQHLSEYNVTSAVADEMDVDAFGTNNIGELAKRGGRPLFTPCTPKGVMVLLEESGVDLKGKFAVVLGRSNIVGSPVSHLLKNADATVVVCHSHTVGIEHIIKLADVLVAAIGSPRFVKGEWLKPGVVVIDVGTNCIPDATKKSGQRLVGDVDFASASEVASKITPVPGGVGPMTVAMLLQNVVDSATRLSNLGDKR